MIFFFKKFSKFFLRRLILLIRQIESYISDLKVKLYKKGYIDDKDETILKKRSCPKCFAKSKDKIIPSIKFDPKLSRYIVSNKIKICSCNNCGMIFDFPVIDIAKTRSFANYGYYNRLNKILSHLTLQKKYLGFRYKILKKFCNFKSKNLKTLDIGASGIWSNKIAEINKSSKNYLVEPSEQMVNYSKKYFPKVKSICGKLENTNFKKNYFNYIFLFDSIYCLEEPRKDFKLIRKILKDNGKVIMSISHKFMNNKMFQQEKYSQSLEMIIRSVYNTYYNKDHLENLLLLEGFKIDYYTIRKYPDKIFENRETTIIILKKSNFVKKIKKNFNSKKILINICKDKSKESLIKFCKENSVKKIFIDCKNKDLKNFILKFIKTYSNLIISDVYEKNCLVFTTDKETNVSSNIYNITTKGPYNLYPLLTNYNNKKILTNSLVFPAKLKK